MDINGRTKKATEHILARIGIVEEYDKYRSRSSVTSCSPKKDDHFYEICQLGNCRLNDVRYCCYYCDNGKKCSEACPCHKSLYKEKNKRNEERKWA